MSRRDLVAALLLAAFPASAAAQGTLSAQGFGYPWGQLSSRATSTGGAFAEFDQFSTLNPSSLIMWGRAGLYVQADPESRSIDLEGNSASTRTTRLGLVMGAVRFGSRGMLAVSSSPLLDRTWGNTVRGTVILGPDTADFSETYRASGSINDLRVAMSWAIGNRFVVGLGAHTFPGEQRLSVRREFDDTTLFGDIDERVTLSYSGFGFSGGFQAKPFDWLGIAASGRLGGRMRARQADTLLAEADVPDRFGVGVRVDRISGVSIAARVDRTFWTNMASLGTEATSTFDSWEYGVGADFEGPLVGAQRSALRVGARSRTLPFGVNGERVDERGLGVGVGVPLARGRASLDVGLERLRRSANDVGARENAWHFSIGLAVRP